MEMSLAEKYMAQVNAEKNGTLKGNKVSLKEALSTPELSTFLHATIVDVIKETAEPFYVASKFFKPVHITEGRSIIFPILNDMVAHRVAEGMNYPEEHIDAETLQGTTEISVEKIGIMVRITDEMISDAQWDVIGIMLSKAGRAMARYKEEWCFKEFVKHGRIIFDPVKAKTPGYENLAVSGLAKDRKTLNDTLAVEDIVNLLIGNIANGYQTTDILMHPLVWTLFVRNPIFDRMSIGAFGGVGTEGETNQVVINPSDVQGKLPFAVNVTLTPFAPIDLVNKRFQMFVVDRNEVGILLVKEDLTTEQWDNPDRDIKQLKVKERYAPGITNNGRAISVANNIAFSLSYPLPEYIQQIV